MFLNTTVLQTGNDLLDEWLPHRDEYLSILLENEGPRSPNCHLCHLGEATYRCIYCFANPQLCQGCIISTHTNCPFHLIERWNGDFFQPATLMDIGFTLHLGHAGLPCPTPQDEQVPDIIMCVVDTLGITHHRIQPCCCKHPRPLHIQLLQMKLFPSTINRPQTVFTFSVLDRYHIESLEGKTSASNFYSQLRRITNNRFPHLLPVCITLLHSQSMLTTRQDRYREFMRVFRQWRDLILRKRFGQGHDHDSSPSQAGLALFCPACPQPGINTPLGWKKQPSCVFRCFLFNMTMILIFRPSWLYRRSIVVDGNFSLEHMRMKKSEDDVFLSDGEGYMVQMLPYQEHLKTSIETTQVCLSQICYLYILNMFLACYMCQP